MVEKDHPELSIAQQCIILGISRSSFYYEPKDVPEDPELAILEAILEVLKEKPFYGYRRIARELAYLSVTRKQIRRIMRKAHLAGDLSRTPAFKTFQRLQEVSLSA